MALIRAAEPAASSSEPKVSASMAESVRGRRPGRPPPRRERPLPRDPPGHAARDKRLGGGRPAHASIMRVARKLREPAARCVGATSHTGKESAMRRMTPPPGAALLLTGLAATGLGSAAPAAALEVGQKAPDFTLPAPGGKTVKLGDPPPPAP